MENLIPLVLEGNSNNISLEKNLFGLILNGGESGNCRLVKDNSGLFLNRGEHVSNPGLEHCERENAQGLGRVRMQEDVGGVSLGEG